MAKKKATAAAAVGRQWGILKKGWKIVRISSVVLKNRDATAAQKKRAKSYLSTAKKMILTASKKLGLPSKRSEKLLAKIK